MIKGNTDLWISADLSDWEPISNRELILQSRIIYLKDKLSIENVAFIESLPESCEMTIDNYKLLCVHGSPKGIADGL